MFKTENCVLMVIDVQGKLAQIMYNNEKLIGSLELLIKGIRALEIPVLWIEQTPSKLGPTRDSIAKLLSQTTSPISKNYFSVCREAEIMTALEVLNRKQVLLSGIEAHICVHQTCSDLIEGDYDVQVVTDCISSRTKENYETGIQRMMQSGARMTSVEMILFELMQKPEGDAFRNIAKLLK